MCSCCWSELFRFASCQIRMRDDNLPLAHVAIAVEGASVASPDIIPLMVANSIIGSFDLTYGGGKVGERVSAHTAKQKQKKIPQSAGSAFPH